MIWTLATLCGVYAALLGTLYLQQRALLFPASGLRTPAAQVGVPGLLDVEIHTSDGETLVGWWTPPQPGRAIVLYFHGNGGALGNRGARVRALARHGRGVLIVGYRGYSGSTGQPTEAGLRLDARAAYAWLGRYAPARIVLYGESLGSAVAVELATEVKVGAVVLDAPFTAAPDVARERFWFVPVGLLMRDQFRSVDRVGRLRCPLLILHGERDGIVPIELGRRLFAAAREPKRFVSLPAADHVSVLEAGGLAAVEALLTMVEAGLSGSDAHARPGGPGYRNSEATPP